MPKGKTLLQKTDNIAPLAVFKCGEVAPFNLIYYSLLE